MRADSGSFQVAPRGAHRATDRTSVFSASTQAVVLVLAAAFVFVWPFRELVDVADSNIVIHVGFAEQIAETGVLYPAHFLFHVLTVLVHLLTPSDWYESYVLVMVLSRIAVVLTLWVLVRQRLSYPDSALGAALAIGLPLSLCFASAITLPTWSQGNYYMGYIPPNIYVSPTMVVLQPIALVMFLALLRLLKLGAHRLGRLDLTVVGSLAVLSMLAKPSYAMVMVPAVAIVLLMRLARSRDSGRFWNASKIGAAIFLPVLALMVWTYFSTYLNVQGIDDGSGSGVSLQPFAVMKFLQDYPEPRPPVRLWLMAKFVLSLGFPLVVTALYWRQVLGSLRFRLAWLQLGCGLVYTYLFAESPNLSAGNFTWSAQTALFLLMVVCVLHLIEQGARAGPDERRRGVTRRRLLLCWAAFALHVIGGLGPFLSPTVN